MDRPPDSPPPLGGPGLSNTPRHTAQWRGGIPRGMNGGRRKSGSMMMGQGNVSNTCGLQTPIPARWACIPVKPRGDDVSLRWRDARRHDQKGTFGRERVGDGRGAMKEAYEFLGVRSFFPSLSSFFHTFILIFPFHPSVTPPPQPSPPTPTPLLCWLFPRMPLIHPRSKHHPVEIALIPPHLNLIHPVELRWDVTTPPLPAQVGPPIGLGFMGECIDSDFSYEILLCHPSLPSTLLLSHHASPFRRPPSHS